MNTNISSKECAWFEAEVKVLGRVIKGLRGFEFHKTVEKEHLFGAGQYPLGIQEGNVTPDGSITVLGFELDEMNKSANNAGYTDITELPPEAVVLTVKFQKRLRDRRTFLTAPGVAFTEITHTMEQNAKMREVQLPFLSMDLLSNTI